MYNLNSHYENIFHHIKSIVTHRRVLYLHPYGATQPENIESISDNLEVVNQQLLAENRVATMNDGPLFIFYDQEPIYGEFNYTLLDHIKNKMHGPFVLVTTETNSEPLNKIKEKYQWPVVYYFHHIFAAHDWYRGYKYDTRLVAPAQRKLTKKYITFNRLTSSVRVYRSLLINELVKRDIIDQGYVSYNDVCPDNNKNFEHNLKEANAAGLISAELYKEASHNIASAQLPLRIDYQDQQLIPNHSFVLSAVPETQESFVYVVTETCYWETKCHLTEKIFKPIVSRMPFILVGCAHNLEYLKSYGFRTFDKWFDESYDSITDPILRMDAIGGLLTSICNRSLKDLETMLADMQEVLDYNYNLFYSQEFVDSAWNELTTNLSAVVPK